MNVYSRFWNWLQARHAGPIPQPSHPHAVKLSLRKLEDRQVLSVSAVLVGLDVTFTGDDGGVSADSLVFTIDVNGKLQHNLGGTNGFESDIDLDNQLAGDQTLAVGDLASLNILLGDGADAVDFAGNFDFSSGGLHIVAESITAVGGSLTVHGLTTLDAGSANDISLSGANNFHSLCIVSANNVTLNDTSGILFEGVSRISGDLHLTSSGAISNNPSSELVVDGNAHFSGSSVDLGNSLGDHVEFGSVSFTSIGAVDINEDSSLTIASASTAGHLTLVSVDDVIFNATVHVTGNTSVTAGTTTGGIEVHAKLTIGGSLLFDAADEITIDAEIDPTTVTLQADDDITINAAVTATDLITVSAGQDGSGSVILNGSGSLSADNTANTADIVIHTGATSGNVTLTGTTRADDSVTITSSGAINGAGLVTALVIDLNAATGIGGATALELSGSTVSADTTIGNIEIQNTSAALVSSFQIVAGNGNVIVRNAKALQIQGTIDGNLTATATTGNLTDSGTLTVTGTSTFTTSQSEADIDLGTLAATGPVTLSTAGTTGNANLVNATALALQGTVNGHLTATATTGNLTDDGTLTVTGTSQFTTSNDVVLDNAANDFTGSVTVQGLNVVLRDVNSVLLGQVNAANLTVTAGGLVTIGTGGGEDLVVTGSVTLNTTSGGVSEATGSSISADQLLLLGAGTYALNEANAVATLAAHVDGTISYVNAGSLLISTVGATSGITTVNDDVKLNIQGDLKIGAVGDLGANDVAIGNGNLTLVVTGGIAQTAGNTISAEGLQLLGGSGAVQLNEGNSVATLAANRIGTISYRDVNALTVGSVTDSAMSPSTTTTGITTSGFDVKLVSGGPLSINQAVDLGATGDLTLNVTGTIQQTSGGTITAAGLSLSGSDAGTGIDLGEANDVDTFASNYQGAVYYSDTDDLTVGQITDTALTGSPTITGISSTATGFDVCLVTGGDLLIDSDVNLGTNGDLTLEVTGTISQNTGDSVTASGLQLLGQGTVRLEETGNDVAMLSANHHGTISYRDSNALTIGTVTDTAKGTTTSGLTNDADVKLVTGGNLLLDQAVSLGGQDLFLDVAGTVTQNVTGTISASGLAIVADGGATLDQANDVDTLAAQTEGSLVFHDIDEVELGTVTENASAAPMTLIGVATSNADVSITASTGDVTLVHSINAGTGDVSLEATTGSIVDGNHGQTLIIANDLSLIAKTNIGDITDFAAGTGNAIDVALSGQLLKASVSDAGGEIFLDFVGNLSAAAGSVNVGGANSATAILRATGGNVDVGTAAGVFSLSSGDNLGLESIRVGGHGGVLTLPDAGLNVGTGDLRLRGDHDVRDAWGRDLGPLVADDLALTSGASGGDTILNTNVNTLTAQITGSGAALTVNEANGLTLTDIDTTNGNLTVNASQATAGDITVIDANAGNARVTLATIAHGGGQILDGDSSDSSTVADITAREIDLQAATGIANSAKLEVATSSFAATTVQGDINVRDVSGDLWIASLAGGTNGVSITSGMAGDDICVSTVGVLTVNAKVSNSGTGDRAILLASDGTTASHDLLILADVTTTGGNSRITLLAGDTVSFGGMTTTAAAGSGEVQVRAGRAFNNGAAESAGTAGGDIAMSDGSVIQSDDGNITLSAPDEVQLSIVNANARGTTGDIFISADADSSGSGSITEVLTGETPNLIGDVATLSAATGIGSVGGNANLNTAIETLVATNTTSGGVFIQEIDTLVVGGTGVQTLQGNGGVQIDVNAGSLIIDSAVTAHGAGSVDLNADTAAIVLNAEVRSTAGAIVVTGDSVAQNANITTGGIGTVDVAADNGSITMQDGTTTSSATGQIGYLATENVALSQLNSTSGPIRVTADSEANGSGAITDNTASESSNLITLGTVTLRAATGIGQLDDIDTLIGTLAATNTTTGNIAIHESSGLAVGGTGVLTQAGSGNILITVDDGDLVVSSAITAQGDGNVSLNAENGELRLSAAVSSTTGDLAITGDTVIQNAGGNLGTSTAVQEAGKIGVTADNGSITMADGTSATTRTGSITYIATGDVALSLLTSTSGDLQVTAGSGASMVGAITDNTAGEAPLLVTSGTATLTAETGIGSGGGSADVETSVAVLRITNSTSGNIDITETDTVRIAQLSQMGGGDASLRTTNGTITVDNADAATNAITVESGGSLLLDANGGSANIVVHDGIQATGGNITLQADRDVIANSAPITSVSGNGDIDIVAGRDIQILDTGRQNPVDISVAGAGNVSLVAANTLVLGSDNPAIVSHVTQHTLANDVLIRTGTGSITNTLPLLFDIHSPQLTASGEAVLSITIGRPGESNLAIRIFWGDGTVQTITGLAPGTYTYSHFYVANPNPLNPAAPILINVQAAHDPHLVLRAPNVNTPVGSVLNSGVNVPPPVPFQNINADLSAAIYNSSTPAFAQLQPNIASSPGNEANPGQVIFQGTSLLATTIPVAGDGLATAVFDTTPPVTYLTFPEPPKTIDTQPSGGAQLSEGTLGLNETARTEDSLIEERAVILEVLSPDGTVLERVTLPESALDDMHEVIGKLPDGGYRFLLKEPGEDRLRLLLEFDVRQGKIADETDASDRPPSAAPKKPAPPEETSLDASEKTSAVPEATSRANVEGTPMSVLSGTGGRHDDLAHRPLVNEETARDREPAGDTLWGGWSTVAARLAWRRAGQLSTPDWTQANTGDDDADSARETLSDATHRDFRMTDDTGGSHTLVAMGVMTAIVGMTSTAGASRHSASSSAKLSRASQLFRRYQNAEPGRGGTGSTMGGDVL